MIFIEDFRVLYYLKEIKILQDCRVCPSSRIALHFICRIFSFFTFHLFIVHVNSCISSKFQTVTLIHLHTNHPHASQSVVTSTLLWKKKKKQPRVALGCLWRSGAWVMGIGTAEPLQMMQIDEISIDLLTHWEEFTRSKRCCRALARSCLWWLL